MKKDNARWIALFFFNTGIGIFFVYILKILFSNSTGTLPFIGLSSVFLLSGISSLTLFFLEEKILPSSKLPKICFILIIIILSAAGFITNKYTDIKILFIINIIFIPVSIFLLLIYKADNKEPNLWYYISFIGIPIGIILYIVLSFLFFSFMGFILSLILIIFSGWFILWQKNLYLFMVLLSLTLLLVFTNNSDKEEKFYGKILIKETKENIFSKETVEVKGVFLNNQYYTFYFNNEKSNNFKNSVYELLYSKITESSPSILILNGGGGVDIAAAIFFNAKKIDATENNPEIIELLKDKLSSYTGGIYHHRSVMYYRSETLPFLVAKDKKYNIIQVNDSIITPNTPLINFSIETIENYKNLLEKNGFIYFIFRKIDKPTISVVINTLSTYLKKSRKTLYETVRIIKINNSHILIFKPEGFDQQQIAKISEFCSQNSYNILTTDQFLDKKELKEIPYIEKNRIFGYNLITYNFKEDIIHSKFSLLVIVIGILIISVLAYIILKNKKNLKNVYISNLLLYSIFSLSSIGLAFPGIIYYIWALFEDTFLASSLSLCGIFFFTIISFLIMKHKIKLNRTSVIIIHSLFIVFLTLYFIIFDPIKNSVANLGFIKRIIFVILILSPLFLTIFSSKIFAIRWWGKINEKTLFLNWSLKLLVFSLSLLIGILVSFFSNLIILWISSILLEVFSLLTFLKLDNFYKKNNYIYRRYGI